MKPSDAFVEIRYSLWQCVGWLLFAVLFGGNYVRALFRADVWWQYGLYSMGLLSMAWVVYDIVRPLRDRRPQMRLDKQGVWLRRAECGGNNRADVQLAWTEIADVSLHFQGLERQAVLRWHSGNGVVCTSDLTYWQIGKTRMFFAALQTLLHAAPEQRPELLARFPVGKF